MPDHPPRLTALDHLVLTVADIDRSLAFYGQLGMTPLTFDAPDGSCRHALAFGR